MHYTMEQAQEAILKACRAMKDEGLIVRTWGNVSARLTEDAFLITPSGRDYDGMEPEDLVMVSVKDLKARGKYSPSSEKAMHAEIYKKRPECGFIVHTHQKNASALSVAGEDLDIRKMAETPSFEDPGTPVVSAEELEALGDVVPCAKYAMSSTKLLARNVAKAVGRAPGADAVLMRCHGAVCFGEDEEQAMRAAQALETACAKIYEKKCGETIDKESDEELKKELTGGAFLHVRTPFVLEMSKRGRPVAAYLDDMAQMGGAETGCVGQQAGKREIAKALKGREAVFVKDDGAICIGMTADDAEAVALVLEKNCMAANYALKKALKPVPSAAAAVERRFYLKKYSTLKEED